MDSRSNSRIPLAIVLEGVRGDWQANVLQVLARPGSAEVTVEGHGVVQATAFSPSPDQARHLATQITELLGGERAG